MVPSNETPTEKPLSWEGSGSEAAEDGGKSGRGGFEFTISLDAGDGEKPAVKGVGSSATADHSKLGSEEEAMSWKLKPGSIGGSLGKQNSPPASASQTPGSWFVEKGGNLSWSDCAGYGRCSASVSALRATCGSSTGDVNDPWPKSSGIWGNVNGLRPADI